MVRVNITDEDGTLLDTFLLDATDAQKLRQGEQSPTELAHDVRNVLEHRYEVTD